MATHEQQLVDLIVVADETIVVQALQDAIQQRQKKGLGTDIVDHLQKVGIKVLTSPLEVEKPFLKSKKFWAGMIALAILIVDEFTTKDLWKIAAAPLVYMFGQGLADLGKNKQSAAA